MTSLSKSSNKAKKQTTELKPFQRLNYSSLETRSYLSLQSLSYKWTEKLFKKLRSSKIQMCF